MPDINRVYLVVTKLSSATHPSGARFGRFIRSIGSRFFTTTAGWILTAGRNDQNRQVTSAKPRLWERDFTAWLRSVFHLAGLPAHSRARGMSGSEVESLP